MFLEVEVTDDGLLKVNKAEYQKGTKIVLPTTQGIRPPLEGDGSWESFNEIFQKIDKLNFPRRTHEEIIRDLHEFRGTE